MIPTSKVNLSALLNLFVADDITCRPMLEKPIEQDGYINATDTHIAIRIPKSKSCLSFKEGDSPKFARVFPKSNPEFAISFDSIEKAIAKCKLDINELYETCPDCGGGGTVEWEYTDTHGQKHCIDEECPVCDGDGKSRQGEGIYIQLGDKVFSAHYFIRLYQAMRSLEVGIIKITPNGNFAWLFEPCKGVEIVLMPCSSELREATAKIKPLPIKKGGKNGD